MSLLLGELILRLVIPPMPDTYGHIHKPSENRKLVYELIPNSKGVVQGAKVKINSCGLRDYEYPLQKTHDVYRIIVIGDSWTFGTGVELEDIYVKKLEKLLNTSGSPVHYEVINCGVGGFNTVREVEFIKEKNLLELCPDLVIIGYNIHNMEIGHQYRGAKQKSDYKVQQKYNYEGPKTTFLPYDVLSKLKNSSVLLQTITYRNEALLKILKIRNYEPLYSDSSEGWNAAKVALGELSDMARSREVKVLLAMFPVLSNLDDSYPFSGIHKIVGQFADSLGILFFDLFTNFKSHNARDLWLHPQDRHPNVTGHIIVANGIYQYLIEHRIVPIFDVMFDRDTDWR